MGPRSNVTPNFNVLLCVKDKHWKLRLKSGTGEKENTYHKLKQPFNAGQRVQVQLFKYKIKYFNEIKEQEDNTDIPLKRIFLCCIHFSLNINTFSSAS